MAILKTYPLKSNYYGPDRMILSDMEPDSQGIVHGNTKNITMSNLKSFIGSQVMDVSASTTDRYKGAFVSPSTGNVKVGIDLLPLTMLLAPNGFDLLLVTDDPTGNPINKKTTVDNFFSSVGLITNSSINYTVKLPNTVGGASQVLQLPSVIGSSPHQLEWSTPAGTGTVIGSGTTNYIPKWNSSTELTDSIVVSGANTISVSGVRPIIINSSTGTIDIKGPNAGWANGYLFTGSSGTNKGGFGALGSSDALSYYWIGDAYDDITMVVQPNAGSVGIGTTSPSDGDLTIGVPKLHVAVAGTTGTFNLAARFQSTTVDDDNTGTSILINSSNDRGLLIKAGRKDGDREVAYFDVVNAIGDTTNMLTMGKFDTVYNVGIGTTTPTEKLEVNGNIKTSVDFSIRASRSSTTPGVAAAPIYVTNSTTGSGGPTNFASNVAGGNGSRHIEFYHAGTAVGSITSTTTNIQINGETSDQRKKKNIVDWTENVLDKFALIEPKKFNFTHQNDSDPLRKGFIAQQMVDKFPEAYNHDYSISDTEGYYSFNAMGMNVYLMKAVKELKEEIDSLKSRISTLEG